MTIVFNNHTKPMVTPTDSDIVASLDHAGVDENAAADGMLVTHPSTVESRTKSSDAADAVAKDTTQLSAASGNTTPSSEGPQYTVEVYINGVLDVKLEFSHLVLGNNHTANFFKDVSFSGKTGLFVSNNST